MYGMRKTGLTYLPDSSSVLKMMAPVIMVAVPMVGFTPPPERGPAMRTTTYRPMATVRLESIPSVVADTFLYLTERTVDTKIIVKKASTISKYIRYDVVWLLSSPGGIRIKTFFYPRSPAEMVIAVKAPRRSTAVTTKAIGKLLRHFPSIT